MIRCSGLFVAAALFAGCGEAGPKKPEMVPVEGTVTFDGKPVKIGTVILMPDTSVPGGSENSASGELDENGKFIARTFADTQGVPPGTYQVAIQAFAGPIVVDKEGNEVPRKKAVPDKYFDPKTSGINIVVKSGEPQKDWKLELKP